jgi:hypothetical protein
MRTLEQVLKARGYSDAELAALAPALNDPRFRKSLEEEISNADNLAAANQKLTTDMNAYDKWFMEEITPEHTKILKEREDAIADAAASKARLDLLQRSRMQRQGENQDPAAMAAARAEEERVAREASEAARLGLQPKTKYVDEQTFQGAFEATGSAIASAVNLARQHEKLFGADADLDMEVLYAEAKAAKMPVKAFWEKKYHVSEKRAEAAQKQGEAHDAKIRADERQKMSVEFGLGSNPNIRTMVPSNNPFVIRKQKEGDKQPWEKTESELTNARLTKAVEKAASRGEL